jgi:hypothetical protein
MTDLKLTFDVTRLVAAEAVVGKPISAIVEEAQSPDGLSLGTLRALIAVGSTSRMEAQMARMTGRYTLGPTALADASRIIEREGLAATSTAVGAALGKFLSGLNREAA